MWKVDRVVSPKINKNPFHDKFKLILCRKQIRLKASIVVLRARLTRHCPIDCICYHAVTNTLVHAANTAHKYTKTLAEWSRFVRSEIRRCFCLLWEPKLFLLDRQLSAKRKTVNQSFIKGLHISHTWAQKGRKPLRLLQIILHCKHDYNCASLLQVQLVEVKHNCSSTRFEIVT